MSENKRKILFNRFSNNFEWLIQDQRVKIDHPIDAGMYMCPLCARLFKETDLSQKLKNPLTLEHVPPDSLGGKARILSCKECNSTSGDSMDKQLLNKQLQWDFTSLLPGAKTKTQFDLNGNKVNGTLEIDKNGAWIFKFSTAHSDPKMTGPFKKDLLSKKNKLTFTKNDKIETKLVEVAMLRIAYLYAFSFFGHGFLLSPTIAKVREQIKNPKKNILPRPYWIVYDFSKDLEGINFIKEPNEIRCLLIVFTLKTKSKERRYGIALPGPTVQAVDLYTNLGKVFGTDGNVNKIKIEHIEDNNFIGNKKDVFVFQEYWNWVIS